MKTTFVAIANLSGIACASDTDHTVYQLSKATPLAVAVNPHSPIPWEEVIKDYLLAGTPQEHASFLEYVNDFELFLSKATLPKNVHLLSEDNANAIFMGYGKDDLFPCFCEAIARFDQDSRRLRFNHKEASPMTHEEPSGIHILGEFQNIATILWGSTQYSKDFCFREYQKISEVYLKRIKAKFKGTTYEQQVEEQLSQYDPTDSYSKIITRCSMKSYERVLSGISTFSIQDMVDAVETLVNAEVRLDHLSSGLKAPSQSTREIAVITRIEGLTWIKHSLYAL